MSFSKALKTVVRGYGLVDVWETVPLRAALLIILQMERHALIKYTSHQTLVPRRWEWKP